MSLLFVNNLRLETGGLDLNSTATQQVLAALLLWLHRSTHHGVIDKHPVLAQPAEPEALLDHERFTQAWPSCLEPGRSVVKVPKGETVSLRQAGVPYAL